MVTPSDTNGLLFRQASEQQLHLVWTVNAEAWAAPISTADHVVRERFLSQQGLTGDRWRTFVLFREEDEIIASCEVFEKDIFVSDGEGVREERGFGVASVFTNPVYRRQKMAELLLGNLVEWMDGEGGGSVSVLYSDIGKAYYEKLGWTPYSTRQLVLQSKTDLSDKVELPEVYPLKDDRIQQLCEEDIQALRKKLTQPVEPDDSVHIAFLPTAHQIQWHLVREDHMAKALFAQEKSAYRGAIAKSRRAWLIWYFDHVEKKCMIQRIVLLDNDERERNVTEVASLLHFAQQEAESRCIEKVIIWNPCHEVEQAGRLLAGKFEGTNAEIEERSSSIPALRRRNKESTDNVVWKYNEYYAWC